MLVCTRFLVDFDSLWLKILVMKFRRHWPRQIFRFEHPVFLTGAENFSPLRRPYLDEIQNFLSAKSSVLNLRVDLENFIAVRCAAGTLEGLEVCPLPRSVGIRLYGRSAIAASDVIRNGAHVYVLGCEP